MRKIKYLIMTLVATLALSMTTLIAYCGCFGAGYSPKLPVSADKLKKF